MEHKYNLCTILIKNLLGSVVYLYLQPFSVRHSSMKLVMY
jgi:hypothetical protein